MAPDGAAECLLWDTVAWLPAAHPIFSANHLFPSSPFYPKIPFVIYYSANPHYLLSLVLILMQLPPPTGSLGCSWQLVDCMVEEGPG